MELDPTGRTPPVSSEAEAIQPGPWMAKTTISVPATRRESETMSFPATRRESMERSEIDTAGRPQPEATQAQVKTNGQEPAFRPPWSVLSTVWARRMRGGRRTTRTSSGTSSHRLKEEMMMMARGTGKPVFSGAGAPNTEENGDVPPSRLGRGRVVACIRVCQKYPIADIDIKYAVAYHHGI